MYTIQELEAIRKKFDSPKQPGVVSPIAPRAVSSIVAQAFPELHQPVASTAAVADVLEDAPAPVAPVAKADPVALTPVAPEEKVINGVIFKKVRKVKR
jgi:hypothetical protein